MMDVVPDNEQQPGPPALRPPSEPAPIDPEQVRQFQLFQQFQELMKEGRADLVPLPAARKRPLWQRILLGKLIRKLALLAVVLLGLYFAYNYYFGDNNDDLPASMTGGGTYRTNVILDKNPYETVRKVYHHIAQNVPEQACGRFEQPAEEQFVAAHRATTCADAVAALHAEVTNRNSYAEVDFRGKMGQIPQESSVVIDSCDLGVAAGPKLGVFTVKRTNLDQWIISGYRFPC